jgi:hypothetical protein
MKASFKCEVCGEKLTLTGTLDGIKRARFMWLKGHEHPVGILTLASTAMAAPVNSKPVDPNPVYPDRS